MFCLVHLFHSSKHNFSRGILFKKPLGSFHLRATITDHRPSPTLRMPLTLPADWELQSPLPNLYCYRALPLAAQIERRLLLVEQNCSGSSHWSKSRVAVMQEQYFSVMAGTTWWCLSCVISAQGFPALVTISLSQDAEAQRLLFGKLERSVLEGSEAPRVRDIFLSTPNCYITLYNSPSLLANTV